MIRSLKLKNFRKHRELSMTFNGGLTTIRGPNEGGKSTLGEAIAYALFGSSALRDSLDDVVTWGEPTASLKAELEMTIDGVLYTVKRSKASAELSYPGGMVTNQKEVTAYACRLLKVDAAAAARLTLSNQNEIRGALEAGPKATTELIERLAEFDQIDRLIELMQEKLTLGNTLSVELAARQAQEALERAQSEAVPFDRAALETVISGAQVRATAVQADLVAAEAAEQRAVDALAGAREQALELANAGKNAARTGATVQRLSEELSSLAVPALPDNVEASVEGLRAQIVEAANAAAIAASFAKVLPFTKARAPDAPSYEGSAEEMAAEVAGLVKRGTSENLAISEANGRIKLLEQKLTHGSCTFCGKDFSGVPEVALKNAEVQAELDQVTQTFLTLVQSASAVADDLKVMRQIETDSQPALKLLAALPQYAELADNELPPVLQWTGPDVGKVVVVGELKAQIEALELAKANHQKALIRQQSLQTQLLEAKVYAEAAQLELANAPDPVDTDTLQARRNEARERAQAVRGMLTQSLSAVSELQRRLADVEQAYQRALAAVADLKEQVEARQKDIATMEFNNALLKRVRQCRPLIADNLWNVVLTAVSSYFSEIRGVRSVVSKEADGFKVDGHSVTSMSGSTLDALGLAIRVALVRTFLPSAPFLILDEPAAAMDSDRTMNMLGFLSLCGFQQILLVTHEEVSSDIADNIITL